MFGTSFAFQVGIYKQRGFTFHAKTSCHQTSKQFQIHPTRKIKMSLRENLQRLTNFIFKLDALKRDAKTTKQQLQSIELLEQRIMYSATQAGAITVSYTHLTLPTKA